MQRRASAAVDNPMTATTELLPCPCCGTGEWCRVASSGVIKTPGGFVVICDAHGAYGESRGCGLSTGFQVTETDAIAAWNRRTPPAVDGVSATVYESAVRGRQDFRRAYAAEKKKADKFGVALMMIREGCAEPARFAGEILDPDRGIDPTPAQAAGVDDFTEWLSREMPAGTEIGDPAHWAKKIYARLASVRAAPSEDEEREAFVAWLDDTSGPRTINIGDAWRAACAWMRGRKV